ncbi:MULTISPECIES: HEPN domain-containing protein [Pseudomonas]|uniref:HEPN domain-containing protein n=1 Tax=Pseudomonas TaxID=286 RepID=UPI000C1999E7|nr:MULTISPECIES: HEPN domain-containing protein [Pseudomonas]PIK76367.1 hypothetical protein CQW31_22520 [Pseudomonas sp. 382]
MSNALISFQTNQDDIEQLWQIHEDYAGQGPGRKYGVEVLNRSVVVFVTACWESYVEDLAREAFDFLLANAADSTAIPSKVKNFAVSEIHKQKDPSKLWDIADQGWREVLALHRDAVMTRWLGGFNTPKTGQVNDLFSELLGIPKISNSWKWKKMSPARAEEKLDDFITVRGNIAHRIRDEGNVAKSLGFQYLSHVISIVYRTEAKVAEHLHQATGVAPWVQA